MNLLDYSRKITEYEPHTPKEEESKFGYRIMRPEYSIDQVEIKTFPPSDNKDIFILCWRLCRTGNLFATIKPSAVDFVYHSTFHEGEKTQVHTHDYIELAYVVEGEFEQRIMGQDIKFKKGEICLIDKNCLHQDYLFLNESIVIFIGLSNEVFDDVMVNKIEEEGILNFLRMALMKQKDVKQFLHFKPKLVPDSRIEELLLLLLTELENNDEASEYICRGLLIRILRHISTKYDFYLSNEQRKKMNWLVFEEIDRYIREHYENITIRDLVQRFHFNEDYYNRLLKDKTGMTYSEYLQSVRLSQAEKLLITTTDTVDEIARQVGYHNKGYFYKIFTERVGMTPFRYRKKAP